MAKKTPKPQALREAFDLELSTGNAALRLPARMTWEDRHRLKSLIDLIPDPPHHAELAYVSSAEDAHRAAQESLQEVDYGGGMSE